MTSTLEATRRSRCRRPRVQSVDPAPGAGRHPRPRGRTKHSPARCPAPPCTTRSRPTRTPSCSAPSRRPGAGFDVASPAEIAPASPPARGPTTWSTPTRSSARADIVARPRARRAAVRRRLARGDPQGRRRRTRGRGAVPASSPRARARTGRCRASTAARPTRPSTSCGSPPRSGLDPAGVSFHVGSQQRDPAAWRAPIEARPRVFAALARATGLRPWLSTSAAASRPARRRVRAGSHGVRRRHRRLPLARLRRAPARRPWSSPVAASSADAGTRRHQRRRGRPTAATPAGSSSTPGSSPGWSRPSTRRSATGSSTPASTARPARACSPAPPATAPTCSTRRRPVQLPLALAEGDEVRVDAAGAYSTCYSTVGFNGFAPLPTVLVDR